MFDFFNQSSKAYAKRAKALLTEARFAQLEHEAAAEHHRALAQMYAARVQRLEAPLSAPVQHTAVEVPEMAPPAPETQRTPLRVLKPTDSQVAVG